MSSPVSSLFWEMSINNVKIEGDKRACITSIVIDELCDGSDTCTIDLMDPNFSFIEDNIFIEDAPVTLNFGFNEDTDRQHFSGYISAIDIAFPEEGSPSMTITCLDESHLLNREKKNRTWENVSRPDVVRKIAQEYGLGVDIEPNYSFTTEKSIAQSKQTDIEFLESLAGQEREPFMCKLSDGKIIYKKKGLLQTPTTTIGYKTYPFDVVNFGPQITKESRQEKITDGDVGATTKAAESYTATDSNTDRDVSGIRGGRGNSGSLSYTYDPVERKWKDKYS